MLRLKVCFAGITEVTVDLKFKGIRCTNEAQSGRLRHLLPQQWDVSMATPLQTESRDCGIPALYLLPEIKENRANIDLRRGHHHDVAL